MKNIYLFLLIFIIPFAFSQEDSENVQELIVSIVVDFNGRARF